MKFKGILTLGFFLMLPTWLLAAGLGIVPGSLDIQAVRPGDVISLKAMKSEFTIRNLYPNTRRIGAKILPGTALGSTQFLLGYRNLPAENWVTVSPDTFVIGPLDSAKLNLVIKIDKSSAYYNQQFCFQLYVWAEVNSPDEMVQVGLFVPIYIETADTNVKLNYYGTNVVYPSVLRFNGVRAGTQSRLAFTLQNNYIDDMNYKFALKAPRLSEVTKMLEYGLSRDAMPIQDSTWISIPQEITIPSKGEKTIAVNLNIPATAKLNPGLQEIILLVKPETGLPTMVRALIQVEK